MRRRRRKKRRKKRRSRRKRRKKRRKKRRRKKKHMAMHKNRSGKILYTKRRRRGAAVQSGRKLNVHGHQNICTIYTHACTCKRQLANYMVR